MTKTNNNMKLELKHIAPYLPYGLTNQRAFHTPKKIDGIVGNQVYFGDSILFIHQIEPIMRPLSDLTKVIEHNGEKFVPTYRLGWKLNFNPWDSRSGLSAWKCNCEYADSALIDIQLMYEWHFDVNGLIDAKLAIDINTLNK